jgi:hypothetical protein
MKRCVPCSAVAVDALATCFNCGEASWLPIKAAPIDPAPVVTLPPPAIVAAPIVAEPAPVPAVDVVSIPEPIVEPAPIAAPSPILANPQPAQPHRGTRWQRGNR